MHKLAWLFTTFMLLVSFQGKYEIIDDQCTLRVLSPSMQGVQRAKVRLEGGLEMLLISDPGVHQSCAALAVDAGSWQDSDEHPGIAHFLEHMLFMGTTAYPGEAEYKQFISDHGGSWNAYTAASRTVYGFSINNEFLDQALDRFSHFFIDPLFLQNCADRELQAVDQEHAKNIEHDGWRGYMILKETGSPSHPNRKFSTGNHETLAGIPHDALQTWYEEHYTAERMHLVVISPFPIETMIEMAVSKFSRVPHRGLPPPTYPFDLFSDTQKGRILYITPVKDVKQLSLLWQLPREAARDSDTHATSLIAYVLANGDASSLCEELKREKLIENLSVSIDRLSAESLLFSIDCSLTEAGVQQRETVIERTFQAIAKLKESGVPQYIFDETQKLASLKYEYQSRQDPFDEAMEIAGGLTEEPLVTYPQKTVLATRFDPQAVQAVLQALKPETCLYLVTAHPSLTGVATTEHERWMGAEYTVQEIPHETLTAWASISPHPHIGLPSPNPYFPDSLTLVEGEAAATPSTAVDTNLGRLYFQHDTEYKLPEICAIFDIKTPAIDGSAFSHVLTELYLKALSDKLSSTLFFATQAGLALNASQVNSRFQLTVSGYSDKAPLLIKTVFEALPSLSPTAAEFEIYKTSLLASYDNASKELPLKQAVQTLNSVLLKDSPSAEICFEALRSVSHEQFLAFACTLFHTAYLEGILYGNLTQDTALAIWNAYQTAVHPEPFPIHNHHRNSVFIAAETKGPLMIVQSTERQGNGALLLLYEGPFSMRSRAVQQILSAALRDDFFETLRSKQQTGYIATSWDKELENHLFQFFGVQSITHTPSELLARFELFLEEFARDIRDKIPSARFETLQKTLIHDLEKPAENMTEKVARLHHFAFEKEGDFQWPQKRIESVKALDYDTFVQLSKSFLSRQNKRRIAVLMEGVLPTKNQFQYEPISPAQIIEHGPYVSGKEK